jgi:hypothetical protein
MTRWLLLAALLALALPATAGARVVFQIDNEVWVAENDGSAARRVARDGFEPTISPDGRYVAFQRRHSYVIAAVDGATPIRTLPKDVFRLYDTQAWSPADELVGERAQDDGHRIDAVAVNPATGALRELGPAGGDTIYSAAFSPDGSQIALEHASLDRFEDPTPRAISIGGRVIARGERPLWGPAGIAYLKPFGTGITPFGELRIVTPAGAPVLTLHRPKAYVWPVRWMADGRLLAATGPIFFEGRGGSRAQPLIVDPATGAVTPLPGRYFDLFGLSADNSTLFAQLAHSELPVEVSLADGRRTVVADWDSFQFVDWAP